MSKTYCTLLLVSEPQGDTAAAAAALSPSEAVPVPVVHVSLRGSLIHSFCKILTGIRELDKFSQSPPPVQSPESRIFSFDETLNFKT